VGPIAEDSQNIENVGIEDGAVDMLQDMGSALEPWQEESGV